MATETRSHTDSNPASATRTASAAWRCLDCCLHGSVCLMSRSLLFGQRIAARQMFSRSLTDVSDEFTDKKVLLVFSWGKRERDGCGLIHLRRPLHLNRFCRFPKNVDACVIYRSNG